MLRDLSYGLNKPVKASYKAAQSMKTGVAVVINDEEGTFDYPSDPTSENVYFVDKERVATGYKAGIANLSDYDDVFVNVAENEFAKLKSFTWGDEFATDADGSPTKGATVAFSSEGKVVDATSASIYEYVDDIVDNGHILKKIRVLQTAKTNS